MLPFQVKAAAGPLWARAQVTVVSLPAGCPRCGYTCAPAGALSVWATRTIVRHRGHMRFHAAIPRLALPETPSCPSVDQKRRLSYDAPVPLVTRKLGFGFPAWGPVFSRIGRGRQLRHLSPSPSPKAGGGTLREGVDELGDGMLNGSDDTSSGATCHLLHRNDSDGEGNDSAIRKTSQRARSSPLHNVAVSRCWRGRARAPLRGRVRCSPADASIHPIPRGSPSRFRGGG